MYPIKVIVIWFTDKIAANALLTDIALSLHKLDA